MRDLKDDILKLRGKYYGHDASLLKHRVQYTSTEDLEKNLDSSQFSIDLHGFHFECLFHKAAGENLYVLYSNARTGKGGKIRLDIPQFPRWGYYNLLDGCMLCIEDPMYYMYPELNLGWFYGSEDRSCVEASLEIVRAAARKNGISEDHIIFFGSSGGGYAGLYASTFLSGALSISINPQLYIQDFYLTKEFVKNTGFDLEKEDDLCRNNLPKRVAEKKSKHVIILNIESEHDWEHHGKPFCDELDIYPSYGLTEKDNVLFWLYDCKGAPAPHNSFETKSIFGFIDYVSKRFRGGKLTKEIYQATQVINECWHDLYEWKAKALVHDKPQEIIFLGTSAECPLVDSRKECVDGKEFHIKFQKYELLPITSKCTEYAVRVDGVGLDSDVYFAGIYDYVNHRFMHVLQVKKDDSCWFHFVTGKTIRNLAFCIDAKLTKFSAEKILVGRIEVMKKSLI